MTTYLEIVTVLFSVYFQCVFLKRIGLSLDYLSEIQAIQDLANQDQAVKASPEYIPFDVNKVEFYVSTTSDKTTKLYYNETRSLRNIKGFSTDSLTVFVIHGWINSHLTQVSVVMRDALLKHGNITAVIVDWSYYSHMDYTTSIAKVPHVGQTVASFIRGMVDDHNCSLDRVIVTGHSLGAQISGFVGKSLNGSLGAIVGMDPAGPLYFESFPESRLSSGDAKYVQAIHSNARMLGVNYNMADADFWPNGGIVQPGCDDESYSLFSHNRSYIFMAESINNNNFYARKCNSITDYRSGSCAGNTVAKMGGLVFDTSLTGAFYLNTSATPPFGLGDIFGHGQN
ncbi:phospholipase A1-like [Rhynchophorus ferrugineus]|uniref:phospholipase A1-like n=1 Tax=Rhynchophorus ferrugineus TaxID=354439 RepID=UPI003FCDD861